MLCYIILYHIILYCTTLYYVVLYHTILYYIISYCIIFQYTALYYAILYHIILYYIILFYIILYYIILYYTILYYAGGFRCDCVAGTHGPLCGEIGEVSECDANTALCSQGSTCLPTEEGYKCVCPLGKAGHDCSQGKTYSAIHLGWLRSRPTLLVNAQPSEGDRMMKPA